jgi:hypothetical protein
MVSAPGGPVVTRRGPCAAKVLTLPDRRAQACFGVRCGGDALRAHRDHGGGKGYLPSHSVRRHVRREAWRGYDLAPEAGSAKGRRLGRRGSDAMGPGADRLRELTQRSNRGVEGEAGAPGMAGSGVREAFEGRYVHDMES